MVAEAMMFRLKQLRSKLATLIVSRRYAEMSNERFYSDGSSRRFDNDIAQARTEVDAWYGSNILVLDGGSGVDLSLSKTGTNFTLELRDLSRPGVLRKLETMIHSDQAKMITDYLGSPMKELQGSVIAAEDAVEVYSRMAEKLKEELADVRQQKVILENELSTLRAEWEAKYQDGSN